jgi:hypothetical protein
MSTRVYYFLPRDIDGSEQLLALAFESAQILWR